MTRADLISVVFSIGIVGLTLLAPVLDDRGQLPERTTCMSQRVLGIECPGCGMTRSFVALGRGQIDASVRLNWIAPSLLGLALIHLLARAGKLFFREIDLHTLDVATIVTIILLYALRTLDVWL